MIEACALFFLCQLAGEIAVRLVGAPVPGPVLGVALLFALLAVRGQVPAAVGGDAETLLRNMPLMFVPAGVGILQQLDVVARFGARLVVVVIVSTIVAMVTTAWVFQALAHQPPQPPGDGARLPGRRRPRCARAGCSCGAHRWGHRTRTGPPDAC